MVYKIKLTLGAEETVDEREFDTVAEAVAFVRGADAAVAYKTGSVKMPFLLAEPLSELLVVAESQDILVEFEDSSVLADFARDHDDTFSALGMLENAVIDMAPTGQFRFFLTPSQYNALFCAPTEA